MRPRERSQNEVVVLSLLEAFLPSLPHEAQRARQCGDEPLARYFEYPGPEGHSADLASEALKLCETHLPPEKYRAINTILWLLSTRLGTLLIGGRAALTNWLPPFVSPFPVLSPKQREGILLAWKGSLLAPLRQAYKAIQGVVMFTLFSSHDAEGNNPLWNLVGYPGADPHRPEKPSAAKLKSEATLTDAIVDLGSEPTTKAMLSVLQARGLSPTVADEPGGHAATVDCDVVIVGSGAGGGVSAAVLAQAGLKVVVVEKGQYVKAEDLTTLEKDAYDHLYERGGLLMATEDGGMNIMAGSTVGGGTRINWSVSFRTPDHVRREWSEVHGLPKFTSDIYTKALDAVCRRQAVGTGVQHNKANAYLWTALSDMGVDVEEMPRNCRDSAHCGHCPHGCAYGHKQDATATFLADAAAAGAKILTGCTANTVATSHRKSSERCQATGVYVHPGSRQDLTFFVRAPLVLACGGALHTPALLMRSNISCSGNVGKHLHLHCGAVVAARFPRMHKAKGAEDGRIKLWEGPVMSTYSREAADWSGTGYGPLVSMTSAHPGLLSAGSPWDGAVAYRHISAAIPWMALCCTYIRDRDGGRITLGADGQPRIHYWPSKFDRLSILKGLELGARAMIEAGAEMLFTSQPSPRSQLNIERNADGNVADQARVEEYIRDIHRQGVEPARIALFTLHQMGSCRMGSRPADSVTDGEGECWDCAGLFVADASSFPTATGVNPMITVESIAYMVAEGIGRRWKAARRGSMVTPKIE